MEAEAMGGGAVENVAHDRGAEAKGMGAVDPKLMSAPRLRPKVDKTIFSALPLGYGAFAVFAAHHLARAIVGIEADREVDDAA